MHHYPAEPYEDDERCLQSARATTPVNDIAIAKDEKLMEVIESYRAIHGTRRYLSFIGYQYIHQLSTQVLPPLSPRP